MVDEAMARRFLDAYKLTPFDPFSPQVLANVQTALTAALAPAGPRSRRHEF
jgi:hypothetical protein